MRNDTRVKFNAFNSRVAEINKVSSAAVPFSVEPSIAQNLEQAIQQSSDFLSKINVVTVDQQSGQVLGIGTSGSIASRTDTSGNIRKQPVDPSNIADQGDYKCEQTDFNTALPYAKLDAWAHNPKFQLLVSTAIASQQGRDRLMIGFNGTSVAKTTDRVANPMLQDVNIGWLEKIRQGAKTQNRANNPNKGKAGGNILVGQADNADYKNLDMLVYDSITLLDEWFQDAPDLVVIISRDLIHEKYLGLISAAGNDTEKQVARDLLLSNISAGGLPTYRAPYFPKGTILITSFDNLSIYAQNNSRRRFVKDEPEYNRAADYQSVNEAYAIENLGKAVLVENIQLLDATGGLSSNSTAPTTSATDGSKG